MSNGKIAVLFPGQGSQYVGMAGEFLESDSNAEDFFTMAEDISGVPLRKLCCEGPMEELTRTLYLQPAITSVNLVCWQALAAKGVKADYFAGHSLGEYSALCAAGVLTKEDTIRLVTERGRLMEREANANPGAMAAILGLGLAEVESLLALVEFGIVTIANYNTEQQIVISGDNEGVGEAVALVAKDGGKAIPLKVSGAWHSPLVAGAIEDYFSFMNTMTFSEPETPVVFNVTGQSEYNPVVICGMMARQIASMVRWVDSINYLVNEGVTTFIEVGPKTVLSGLVKKILQRGHSCKLLQVDNPEKIANCLQELDA